MAGERPHMIGSPGYSPALKYEIELAETISKGGEPGIPSRERTRTCFEIFDALIPQLGVFQHVFKMIRDEMYVSVFSDELTSTQPLQKDSAGPYLSRIPYFTIALKWINRRDEKVKILETQVEELKDKSSKDRLQREKADEESRRYKDRYETQQSSFLELQSEVETLRSRLRATEDGILEKDQKREEEQSKRESQICQLENELSKVNDSMRKLAPFKKTHDALQMKFTEPRSLQGQKLQGTIMVSKKVQLQQSLRSALHVQKQLQTMENSLMDDYDTLLLDNKSGLADPEAIDVHMMVRSKQKSFKQSVEELSNELKLLDVHIQQLQSQLKAMNTLNDKEEPFLTLDNPAHPNNPLHAQEQMLNKYAAVISCSVDDCTSFLPLQDGQLCHNCGAQTAFCPHKNFAEGIVIPLPPNATHIRLSRPSLTAPADESRDSSEVQPTASSSQPLPDHINPDFVQIRKLCSKRCPMPRRPPRVLEQENVSAVIELFYATLLRQDALISSDSIGPVADKTAVDAFVSFILNRYGNIQDAAQCALHDMLSALETSYKKQKNFLLFSQQLCEYVSSSAFRYVLCLTELVYTLPWRTVREFELLSKVLYPFMEEETLEDLVVELNSFTGNALAPSLVIDFLILLLLKDQEPRVNKMYSRLMALQMRVPEHMSETEYLMGVDQLAPDTPDKLTRHLFLLSTTRETSEGERVGMLASVKNLAYVTAYLTVRQEMSNLSQKLEEVMDAAVSSGRLLPRDTWRKWKKPNYFAGLSLVAAKAPLLKNHDS